VSSIELEKHLVIELRPSKILLLIVSVINLLALIVVFLFPLGFQYILLLVTMICTNYIYFLYKYSWLIRFTSLYISFLKRVIMHPIIQRLLELQQPIVQICYKGDNDWQLQCYSGKLLAAKLMGSSYSGLNLVVLKFRISNVPWFLRRLSIVILKDGVDSVSFRHLRIHLRLTLNPI